MKSIWNGAIYFGLVSIPIKMFSATDETAIKFRMLHKKHLAPVKLRKFCSKCGKELELEDIVKGIEVTKDKYFVLTSEEIESLKPEKTDSIKIIGFLDEHQIDPIYINKHYYLIPEKEREKAYFLFKEILKMMARVAVGRFVMREKEYVCIIRSYKDGLLLTTLNYDYEIKNIKDFSELKKPVKLNEREISLAKKIVEHFTMKELNMKEYKDSFAEKIIKALEEKKKGRVIMAKKTKEKESELDLMEALEKSLK